MTLAISQVPISNCNLSHLFLMGPVVQPHHNDSNQEASATDYLVLFRCACSFKFFMVCVLRGKFMLLISGRTICHNVKLS